ncbi:MAG: hypothetical protein M0C28_03875 [Candidatus Moduliflexus flocculans]|nr:hypothetical protein [Candidatus Moduliflexus flocculans]
MQGGDPSPFFGGGRHAQELPEDAALRKYLARVQGLRVHQHHGPGRRDRRRASWSLLYRPGRARLRPFHAKADRIHRITADWSNKGDSKIHQLGTPSDPGQDDP